MCCVWCALRCDYLFLFLNDLCVASVRDSVPGHVCWCVWRRPYRSHCDLFSARCLCSVILCGYADLLRAGARVRVYFVVVDVARCSVFVVYICFVFAYCVVLSCILYVFVCCCSALHCVVLILCVCGACVCLGVVVVVSVFMCLRLYVRMCLF